ncbi:hypothetical protein FTX61_11965 [Nitriliruptoraceae bacterium ZYF776]|nr:hypothetical protein [Profundirhabdus halotolerans]
MRGPSNVSGPAGPAGFRRAPAASTSAGPTSAGPTSAGPDEPNTEGDATGTTRESTKVRERLERNREALRRVRATERVLVEQVAYLDEVAADAETRKLVAQTPLADREWREARTDLDRHTALLDEARREATDLLAERDRLLDRLLELEGST